MSKLKEKLKKIIPKILIPIGGLVIVCNMGIICGSGVLKKNKIINDKRFDGIQEYLEKSNQGVPITLPIKKGEYLSVNIINFTPQEQQQVINAINSLDDISQTINFKLSNDVNAQIKIQGNYLQTSEWNNHLSAGKTDLTFNVFTGEIHYPVNIYIKPLSEYSQLSADALEFIIKHELMHAIGFCDLYNSDYQNQTIMYYQIDQKTNIEDFTQLDIANILQVYDGIQVDVQKPQKLNIIYKKEEDFQME